VRGRELRIEKGRRAQDALVVLAVAQLFREPLALRADMAVDRPRGSPLAVCRATFRHDAHVDAWTRTVRGVVKRIPPGRVATYGLVGMVAGRPLAARAIGNVMRACDDPDIPCHRVVRADGAPAFPRHRTLLRREGVRFVGAHVDMARHLWSPRLPQRQTSRPSL
jgi:methylated-DNA-protein-cysteine methyltransferase-like protein